MTHIYHDVSSTMHGESNGERSIVVRTIHRTIVPSQHRNIAVFTYTLFLYYMKARLLSNNGHKNIRRTLV